MQEFKIMSNMKYLASSLICFSLVSACKKAPDLSTGITEQNIKPVDLLSNTKFKTLMVDFVYDGGYPPSADAINNLKNFLGLILNKTGGVQIIVKEISGTGKENISIEDVKDIEKKNRSYFSQGSILGVFVYFANSDFSGNSGNNKVLGTHYGPTSIVLFGKTIKSLTGGIAKPSFATLETAVAEHEFGHAMGLVDHGTPMVSSHMDNDHPKHCINTNCLMHYRIETADIILNLTGGAVPEPDNNCIADLRNNGGK